jgi:hypothetical protein
MGVSFRLQGLRHEGSGRPSLVFRVRNDNLHDEKALLMNRERLFLKLAGDAKGMFHFPGRSVIRPQRRSR